MGGCMSSNSTPLQTKHQYDTEPTDTSQLDPSFYPLLNFKALLTKLKLKRCSSYVLFL